jgi:hypothetical protein
LPTRNPSRARRKPSASSPSGTAGSGTNPPSGAIAARLEKDPRVAQVHSDPRHALSPDGTAALLVLAFRVCCSRRPDCWARAGRGTGVQACQ